ncbi:MAG: Hydroxyacylglutathione hydrolase [Promethearchaeota archaeon]|nr:MAG: Hydroxyacylglutathione hydrolase [Candidatus Lokiarchaeota archaeon]
MTDFIQPIFEDHDDIFFIEGKYGGKVPFSNCLLIADHIIDTGISALYLKRLRHKFTIRKVLFSHWHDDHIRDNRILEDIPFYCHPKCKPIIEDIDKLLDLYAIRGTPVEIKFKEYLSDVIDVYNTKIKGSFSPGDVFQIGSYEMQIISTPGHSVGHCAFHIPELKFAFIGDIDLSKFGPWYGGTDSNISEFIESIEKIRKMDLEVVATGHRGIVRGKELINQQLINYKEIFNAREEKILSFLTKEHPTSPEDLLEKSIIYKDYRFLKPFLLVMEKTMIDKHLQKLKNEGKITQVAEGYVLS